MSDQDLPEDLEELKILASQGNGKAMLFCAFQYESQFDYENANLYYKMGAESGFADAQFFHAFRLENGINVEKDIFEANKYYKLSADQGNKDAQMHYAMNLQEGCGVPQDEEAAKMYLAMAKDPNTKIPKPSEQLPADFGSQLLLAEQGNANAMLLVAFHYEQENDFVKSAEYFKKSADAGNPDAQFCYSLKLENGIGVTQDQAEASRYLQMSIQNGNEEAKDYYNLRNTQKQPAQPSNPMDSLPKDYKQLKKEADKGNTYAQLRCGILLDSSGRYEEANQMFKLSADNGNPNAQFLYGMRLEFGVNILPDVPMANLYYRKSALQGNEDAMFRFAMNLENGNGVKANPSEANKFYRMSADKGHKDAMVALSKNLKTGNGIEKNEKLADELLKKAYAS
ncbi:sel1 repeat family protein [Histomonas meleagridis]|uniref:sel1 repeat family protein n=1 Tax=Histomonas meleagridis TaxID=135588 RepID=UPI00355975D6|nr:sel1 repeat family protein [Histomonas meleagridis]KAH0804341.1 sel1 repeat family protein [Histomonas meleagridis]